MMLEAERFTASAFTARAAAQAHHVSRALEAPRLTTRLSASIVKLNDLLPVDGLEEQTPRGRAARAGRAAARPLARSTF